MSGAKMHSGVLVVICDGRKVLLLENRGDEAFPNLHMQEVLEHDNPATHEQGTGAPGRVHQSTGTARSAVEQTDWHDEAERHFLQMLAKELDAAVTRAPGKRLVVVAAPRALGMLRQAYSPLLRHAISAELDKDWVKMPIHEIEKQLQRTKPVVH
jgi:protein required for attachment to host cells